jgi:hypothetical protein
VSIRGRVRRLEERNRRGPSPECRLPPDNPGYVVWIDEERPEESFDGDPDERCGSCGRYVWCVIKVVYDDAEGAASEAEGGGATVGREMRRY